MFKESDYNTDLAAVQLDGDALRYVHTRELHDYVVKTLSFK